MRKPSLIVGSLVVGFALLFGHGCSIDIGCVTGDVQHEVCDMMGMAVIAAPAELMLPISLGFRNGSCRPTGPGGGAREELVLN